MKNLIIQTKQQLIQLLHQINKIKGNNYYSLMKVYQWFIIKEKSIYSTLNMFKSGEKLLIGLMWCPTKF